MTKKVALIVLDGWGHGPKTKSNAIEQANVPFIKSLYSNYPNAEILTSGENVGLPEGQMGNSEVGHLNIGAGRIVYQDLVKINKAIREKTLDNNPVLIDAFNYAKSKSKKIHFIGLVSDGGIHSHIAHLKRLCTLAAENGCKNVFVHAFTDGRDTDPKSGAGYIADLKNHLKTTTAVLASLVGRYYGMDRDKRWERVKQAYDLLVKGEGKKVKDIFQGIRASYNDGVTDEFIKPLVRVDDTNEPVAMIQPGDVVICFNFRTDRCREITQVLTQKNIPEYGIRTLSLYYVTMTNYDNTFKNINVIFHKDDLKMTLGEVLSNAGKSQVRISETEKYPHVTFFFSGGREKTFDREKRIMIPSPKVPTYDMQPSMSAVEVTDAIVKEMNENLPDFICLNFANPDMVGHTGVFSAVIEAVETIDKCTKRVVETGRKLGYSFIITADHGNADYMINPDGSPNTAHTTNPVPVFLLDNNRSVLKNGILADIAPTVLAVMEIDIPAEMTGKVLV